MTCPSGQSSIGNNCYSNECIIGNIICGGHGECLNESNSCRCQHNFVGPQCTDCSEGMVMVNNKTECANVSCVIKDTICSAKGTCDGTGNNKCTCQTDYSGKFCQCAPGQKQISETSTECADDLCTSPKGECFGRANCILKNDVYKKQFVCNGCGEFLGNDPEKGCTGCLRGYGYISPESEYICVDDFCRTGTTECNGHGKCSKSGICNCKDNFDSFSVCLLCKSGFQMVGDQCVEDFCTTGKTQCNARGTCNQATLQCNCSPTFAGKSCELCSTGLVFVKNNTQCISQECVLNGKICSENGTCSSANKCICSGNVSGKYCQCQPGFKQISNSSAECAEYLCGASDNVCFGRSTCKLQADVFKKEFVCDGCGKFTGNDPRQGCSGCLKGYQIIKPFEDKVCVDEYCITGDTVCYGHGECNRSGFCSCSDNFDSSYSCFQCKSGYKLINELCLQDFCTTGKTQCSGHGICDSETLQCRCHSSFSGNSCEDCEDGMIFIKNKTECAQPNCIINDTICNNNGICVGQYYIRCQCQNDTSGDFCQCPKGYSQLQFGQLQCGLDLCITSQESCLGRGRCTLIGNELVCDSCGSYKFNDPRKGCEECLPGSIYFGSLRAKDCRPEKCITGDTICNYKGVCQSSGICKCTDDNADPNTGCKSCLANYQMLNNECINKNCIYNNTECADKGKCENGNCVCQTHLIDNNTKCSTCSSENALINEFCTVCKPGFELIREQCVMAKCGEGQFFNFEILSCEEIEQKQSGSDSGLVAGIVVLALVLVGFIILSVFLIIKKKGVNTRRDSIVMPTRIQEITRQQTNSSQGLINEVPQYEK
ncbi:Tenascin-like protein [Spironucleus salmonicida]|uniref:Tenascin-like protein n=1 Tax=Spironucleus salmonicida TaxID=348837 RepID=A0A9P8RX20_9EUKA|nr:Tenascin-like protein [Spironucleus salmonicida]